jgi:SNF2 family DNA or RNA helicase
MYFSQPTKWQHKRLPFKGTPEIIYKKLESLAFRAKASDWITLPEEIHNPILLPFPDELKATYAELKKEFIIRLKSQVITAGCAAALSTKLRQLLSGNIYNADKEAIFVHHYKLKALQDFITDCDGKPVLVAYQYRHEVEMFKSHFKTASFIETSTSPASIRRIISDWNDGKIPILFGNPAAIGHGLNLQGGGNTVLFYSLDFNLENYLQFIKRVARQGQEAATVIIHYLVFENTIDEFILEVLQGKNDVQNGLLDYLES